MKRVFSILALVLAMAWASQAHAQFKLGVVGGMNLTSLSFDKSKNFDSENRCGWFLGPKVTFTLPIIGLGIDASVQYMNRRMNVEVDNGGVSLSESKNLQTIEIPLNLRYSFGFGSIAAVYLATGPQFGYNIGNKLLEGVKLKEANTTWNVGVGARLLGHLEVGATYNIALSKFGKIYDFVSSSSNGFKSNTWQVQVGYFF